MPRIDISGLYRIYLECNRQLTTDSRNAGNGQLFFALKGDRFDGNRFAAAALETGASYAVVDDPAVADGDRYLLVDDVLQSLQELARHHRRQFDIPLIALTGSNGKTTTKELVAGVMASQYRTHATRGNLNNHIGVPLTLLSMAPDVECAVIEMGANHQGEIAELCAIAEPTHGLITNIGRAHLEGFGGIEGVKKGKGELYHHLARTGGVAFVNLDAAHLQQMVPANLRTITYKSAETPDPAVIPIEVRPVQLHPAIGIEFLDGNKQLLQAGTRLSGQHNFQNVMTAVAVGRYFKVPADRIRAALAAYVPKDNRSQRVTHDGVDFVLDAYNANPSSMEASLRDFCQSSPAPRAAVIGGMLELGEESESAHREVARLADSLGIERLILLGEPYTEAAAELGATHFTELAGLREWFWQQDWEGFTVLLKGSRGYALEKLLHTTENAAKH